MLQVFMERILTEAIKKANAYAADNNAKIVHFQIERQGDYYELIALYDKN